MGKTVMKFWSIMCLGVLILLSCEQKEAAPTGKKDDSKQTGSQDNTPPSKGEEKKAEPAKMAKKPAPARLEASLLSLVPEEVEMLVSVRDLDGTVMDLVDWTKKDDVFKKMRDEGLNLKMAFPKPDSKVEKMEKPEVGEDLAQIPAPEDDVAKAEKSEKEMRNEKMMQTLMRGFSRESFFCLLDGAERKGEFISQIWLEYRLLSARVYPSILMEMANGNFEFIGEADFTKKMTAGIEDVVRQGLRDDELLQMPNMLIAARMESPDLAKEMRADLLKEIEDEDDLEKIEFEREGVVFAGFRKSGRWTLNDLEEHANPKVKNADVADDAEIEDDDMEFLEDGDFLDAENEEVPELKLFEGLEEEQSRERNYSFVLAIGEKDGALVFFVGGDEAGLRLGTPEKNLMKKDDLAWWQDYADRRVLGMSYTSQEFLNSLRGLVERAPVWAEVRKVYDGGKEGLVNQLLFDRLLDDLVALEGEIEDAEIAASQGIVFLDEGLRMESRGGVKLPGLDRERPWTLQGAEKMQPFFQAHWCAAEATRKRERQQNELVISLLGGLIDEFLVQQESDPDAEKQREVRDFFEVTLQPELRKLMAGWNEISGEGLEGENLVVLDLNGAMPRFPLVPKLYTEKGKMARFLWAKPVKKRKSLSEGWLRWQGVLERIAGAVAELSGRPLSLPGIVSARNDDIWSHFISFPGTTPDFLPCVSVSDRFFSIGSSKKYAEEMATVLATAETENLQKGVLIELDIAQAVAFAKLWATLMTKQAEVESGEEAAMKDEDRSSLVQGGERDPDLEMDRLNADTEDEEDFAIKLTHFLETATIFERLGKWKMREWVENGTLRKSIHLEIKGVK